MPCTFVLMSPIPNPYSSTCNILAIAEWLGRHRFDRLDLAGYLLQDRGGEEAGESGRGKWRKRHNQRQLACNIEQQTLRT